MVALEENSLSNGKSGKVQMSTLKSAEYTLPLYRKLLLTAVMMGNDVNVAFEQLYEVPLLQVLGVPVTYVSLCSVVTGPVVMILMSVLGHFSDKGSSHQKKKMALLAINSSVSLVGLTLLIAADFLLLSEEEHISGAKDFNSTAGDSETFRTNANATWTKCTGDQTMTSVVAVAADISILPCEERQLPEKSDTHGITSLLSIPLTGVLGIMGFIFFNIGYDLNIAATRACVLACSPKTDHTSILLLALVMAALGGCINNSIGLVDFPAIFGITQNRMALQTAVHLFVCILMLVICVTSTVVTAHLNLKSLDHQNYAYHNAAHVHEDGYGTFQHNEELYQTVIAVPHCSTGVDKRIEDTAFIGEECGSATCDADVASVSSSTSLTQLHYNDNSEASDSSSSSVLPKGSDDEQTQPITRNLLFRKISKDTFNFIVACASLYMGTSSMYLYNLYAPDFLGKVVMGGDSTAQQGSAALQAYEDGVGIASGGLLIFYCCYLIVSILHARLLDFWGMRVDFCLSQVLLGSAILCMAFSKQVPAYYLTNVCYGFQRSALLSVPFIITDNYVHNQDKLMASSTVGKMVAVMTCMIPLNYCTLFLISGPLITLTQYDGTPLLLASGSCYMAALIFLMYRP